jgi:Cdc6-like AAA superfamily ATPase
LSRNIFIKYVLSYISLIISYSFDTINEKFQNYDSTGHVLYLLFKLNELTLGYFHHSLILIGHQPFYQLPQMNQIEAELGVLTPLTIFIPAYTRTEIVTILQNILTRMR